MTKRIIGLVSAAAMALTGICGEVTVPCSANAVSDLAIVGSFTSSQDDTWQWRNYGDHIVITLFWGEGSDISIPAVIDGLPVTGLTNDALINGRDSVKSLHIPAYVQDVGDSLAWLNKLEKIEIDKDNKSLILEDGILYSSDKTELIRCIPTAVNGKYTIPDTVTSVSGSAFLNCRELTSITIPASVKNMGDEVFYECRALESISVDADNQNYCSIDGVLFDAYMETLIQYPIGSKNKSYTVPDGIKEIGSCAFIDCDALETVTFSEYIELIDDYAFSDCDKLNNVVIPDSVTVMGDCVFSYCASLSKITFSNNITQIGVRVVYGTPWFETHEDGIIYIGRVLYKVKGEMPKGSSVTVKEGTIGIGADAFSNDSYLSSSEEDQGQHIVSVVLPEGIAYIREYAFSGCSELQEINLPDSISRISFRAFSGCSSLKEVHIPASMKNIEYAVFEKCSSLEEMVLPENIETIDSYAFSDCGSLKSLTIDGDPYYMDDIFGNNYPEYSEATIQFNGTIYGYDDTTVQKYAQEFGHKFVSLGKKTEKTAYIREDNIKSDDTWYWFEREDHAALCGFCGDSDTLDIPNTLNGLPVTEIANYWYEDNRSEIKNIKIPANLKKLNGFLNNFPSVSFFEVDKDNKYFTVENNVLYTADKKTLIRCSTDKIEGYLNIPATVTATEYSAFENCSKLTVINVPASMEHFAESFVNCSSLEAINVAKGNEYYISVNGILFNRWKSTLYLYPQKHSGKSFTIPKSVNYLSMRAFYNCDDLESIDIPSSIQSIPYAAFMDCDKLDNVVIPDSVESIGGSAFENCKSLKSIKFSDNITMFDDYVMEGTPWLDDQPDGPVYCGSAFYMLKGDLSKFKEVKIKDGIKCIADHGFCVRGEDEDVYTGVVENKELTKVTLPDSIEWIGNCAFQKCSALTEVNMPKNAECAHFAEFSGCTSLKDIVLSENDTTIGMSDYHNCKSLTDVVVPERITEIGADAFMECTSLKTITIMNPDCEIDGDAETISNVVEYPEDETGETVIKFNGTICGYDGSTAEKYAKDNGYNFKSLGQAPNKTGDVNSDGKINAVDASTVLTYYANVSTNKDGGLTDAQEKAADVDKNGDINAVDASYILSYYAYKSTTKEEVMSVEEYMKQK